MHILLVEFLHLEFHSIYTPTQKTNHSIHDNGMASFLSYNTGTLAFEFVPFCFLLPFVLCEGRPCFYYTLLWEEVKNFVLQIVRCNPSQSGRSEKLRISLT
jgi:hypothetical protein